MDLVDTVYLRWYKTPPDGFSLWPTKCCKLSDYPNHVQRHGCTGRTMLWDMGCCYIIMDDDDYKFNLSIQ